MSEYTEKVLERNAEEADKLWHQIYDKPDENPPAEEATPSTETPPDEPQKETVSEPVTDLPPVEQVETPPVETQTPPVETPPSETPTDTKDYKQAFNALKGKYKADTTKLSAELAQWKTIATTLQSAFDELKTAKATAAPQVQTPAAPSAKQRPEMTDALAALETEQPEIFKIITQIQEQHQAEMADLRSKLDGDLTSKLGNIESQVQMSAQERFESRLSEIIPEWRSIDTDPIFLGWLNEVEPYTGRTKMALIQQATLEHNAARVAKFFNDYKSAQNQAPEVEFDDDLNPKSSATPASKVEKQVAPPRSGGGTPPLQPKSPLLTRAQYDKFMKDSMHGKYKPADWGGKSEEAMEALFDNAILKGELR